MVYDNQSDEELANRVCCGDKAAYRYLYDRFHILVRHLIYSIVKREGPLEDLVQNVFLKVHIHQKKRNCNKRFKPWLMVIAHNEAISYLRKKKRRDKKIHPLNELTEDGEQKDFDDFPSVDQSPLDKLIYREDVGNLHKMIDSQFYINRRVIDMFFFKGMCQEEVAKMLGLSVPSVKSRVHRVVENMRKMSISREYDKYSFI